MTHAQVSTDGDTGQTIISGMGELHLDIYVERMRREYKARRVTFETQRAGQGDAAPRPRLRRSAPCLPWSPGGTAQLPPRALLCCAALITGCHQSAGRVWRGGATGGLCACRSRRRSAAHVSTTARPSRSAWSLTTSTRSSRVRPCRDARLARIV
jgi:hypothetical protein